MFEADPGLPGVVTGLPPGGSGVAPPRQVNPKKRKAPAGEFVMPHLQMATRAAKRRQVTSVNELIHVLQVERAQRHAAKAEKEAAQRR